MSKPELGSVELATESTSYELDGVIDPIQLATQALAKLRAMGQSGVLSSFRGRDLDEDNEKVAWLDEYRADRKSSGAPAHTTIDQRTGRVIVSQESFAIIYEAHCAVVLNFARNLVGPDQAEDMMNETFLKAWGKIDTFVDQGHGIRPWLMRIAYNLCMDSLRRRKKFEIVDDPEAHIETQKVEVPFLQGIIDEIDFEELLDGLTDEQKEIFIALGLRELSNEEYAKELGISVGALKARTHRARQKKVPSRQESAPELPSYDRQTFYSPNPDGELSQLPKLTAGQNALVAEHMHLVKSVARRYSYTNEETEDLQQIASVGLVKAAVRFDPTRGYEFSTYAYPNIVGEIKRHFRDKAWAVHVPRDLQELAIRIPHAQQKLTAELMRAPSTAEIAEELEVEEDLVLEAIQANQAYRADSLDAPLVNTGGKETITVGDSTPGRDGRDEVDRMVITSDVAAIINTFPERQKEIFVRRFGLGQTQSVIASHLGVSQMHISRLLKPMLERVESELGTFDTP